MNAIRRPLLATLGASWCLIAGTACRSMSVPATNDARERPPALIEVDSQVFAAVVRAQLEGRHDEYPHRLERVRYDSRPYRASSGYPEVLAGVQGTAPGLSFPRAIESESELSYVINTRKRILSRYGVREGAPVFYSQCAGAGVPAPPPPPPPRRRSSAPRARAPNVHAGCPKAAEHYLTVGLPVRGQPPGLENSRDTRGKTVSLKGEVWTVLVDETSTGPAGWRQSRYAWLFRRDRSGRLELAHTILAGTVD